MSSKKEEERIEKIIRGLMKLPPNRRCINCNSLGPQYVCTNFWTFVCTTCSGIHREFTHRVKSVSMAKFTFQEVEALQRGGNQRAREIYLKDWDPQQQRLPGSNNIDKVREFIKHVYVDRRYAGGKTSDKPPRDIQNPRNHEEDTRRASSYHSYSQSPPYEHQYEDRRYGKQAAVLTRRPGSDRGLYEGKVSSFVYSPGRLGEKMFEDSFANEGSVSRVSDYSVSTAGDPFRSGTQSPNLHQDISSPPVQTVRNVFSQSPSTYSEANARRDADGVALPQRTVSSDSIGSFVNNSMPLRSVKSGSLLDNVSEFGQSIGTQKDIISSFPSLSRPSVSGDAVSLDLFNAPPALQPGTSSAPSINFFEPPVISSASSMDFFQTSSTSSDPSTDLFKPATASASSIDFFAEISHQHSATTSVEQRPSAVSFLENTGWATFDLHQHAAHVSDAKKGANVNLAPGDGPFVGKADPILSINTSMKWPPVQASSGPANMQSWNAFEDSFGTFSQNSFENLSQTTGPQAPAHNPLPTSNKYISSAIAENSSKDGFQKASVENKPSVPGIPYNGVIAGSSFTPSVLPSVGGLQLHAFDWKSTNPFDLPYDSALEPNNTFLDMNSLQAALPNSQLQPAFLGGLSQPLYPQNSVTPFISATPQGGVPYITEQASSTQLPNNIPSQGGVASLGGNPFA